jgi:DNA polymerase phi
MLCASSLLSTPTGMSLPLQAYTLQRLVRGLASNRQGARQGFALALTAIVQQADGPSVHTCISLIVKLHAVTNSMPVWLTLLTSAPVDWGPLH